ncbi:MAG: hypothetical protein LBH25_09885 [Fibromonadaceae bacterium]|nr:hypothetical protein [Fibromonadaceae bacterium]
MLEPIRTIRLIGSLVLFMGAVFLFFWKIAVLVISVGMSRYSNFSGKLAKKLFSQDQALIGLLQAGETFAPCLLFIGIFISCIGILIIAFPKQAMQIMCAFRVLRQEPPMQGLPPLLQGL